MTDYGLRNPPVSNDPVVTVKWQKWYKAWSKRVKIGGVCLVQFGVFTIIAL